MGSIASRVSLPVAIATLAAISTIPLLAAPPRVVTIDLDHVVHPLSVEIVRAGLAQAAEQDAAVVILRLNTPGGLLSATEQIIQEIVASPVPVVTWVGPRGGKAASAGFMILVTGDVAAMASGTNTGAAHPVALGGQMDEVMKQKVENDAAARIRSIVDKRGRNVELAEEAVLASRAFTEQEALESNLIDLIADSVESLLERLDGRTVMRFDGSQTILETAGAEITPYELNLRQKILLPLIDPSLAFILLALGMLGLYMEFSNPGLIAPGVLGAAGAGRCNGPVGAADQLGRGRAADPGRGLSGGRGVRGIGRVADAGRRRGDDPGGGDVGGYGRSGAFHRLGNGDRSDGPVRRDYGVLAATGGALVPL